MLRVYRSTSALSDLFGQQIVTVGQFLNQPNHHRLAKFLTGGKNEGW